MKKRLLSAIMAMLIVGSFTAFYGSVPVSYAAEDTAESEEEQEIDFTYIIKDDGTAEISEWLTDKANIYIPPLVDDDILVTSIGEYACA